MLSDLSAGPNSQAAEIRAEEVRRKLIWMIGLATMLMGLFALLLGCRIAKTVASITRQLGDGRFDVVLPGRGSKK
ncbi:hypothetical protein FXV83_35225 [Bradyrhizobium hipponense]|uniref:Uncharacterized protein n=1 Tax=Bradyrhizobium hipponense TaxID=2605638 RepID=A0A5S4YER3_9BRAD|nr:MULTISPECIES: hypothetical protein [Bradyrhizobium]MDE5445225.1 hypothetical protein [Bradyrhizobium sp. CSA207]TYO61967.1 hypothetical protein FXV83_35225 [Bradyrhizobium hipponense]